MLFNRCWPVKGLKVSSVEEHTVSILDELSSGARYAATAYMW